MVTKKMPDTTMVKECRYGAENGKILNLVLERVKESVP